MKKVSGVKTMSESERGVLGAEGREPKTGWRRVPRYPWVWRKSVLRPVVALTVALTLALGSAGTPRIPIISPLSTQAQSRFADGDLLQAHGDDKIYLVEGGARRWIIDTAALQALSPDFSRLRQVTLDELDSVPPGRPAGQITLIRDSASGRVYLLSREAGAPRSRKHWVNDLDSFTKLGLNWSDVSLDWATPPERYADAPALTYLPPVREPVSWQRDGEALTVIPAWRLQTEDEQLYLALALAHTYNVEWRQEIAPRLSARGTWIGWGDLPEMAGGLYHTGLNRITMSRALQGESGGVIAAVLSHEVLHAVSPHEDSTAACFAEEVAAFSIGAATWANLPPPWRSGSSWGRSLDSLVHAWLQGAIERFVVNEPAYRQQCRLP